MKIIVDATPVAINRTAVYHLAWDVVHFFAKKYNASVLLYDQLFSSEEILKIRKNIDPSLLLRARNGVSELVANLQAGKSGTLRNRFGAERQCILYLDPLYCLLDRSIDESVILVHDLTPLTHPSWHDLGVCNAYQRAYEKIQESRSSLVAVSHSTARDLWVNFGIPRGETKVAHLYLRRMEGVHGTERGPLGLPAKRFLFVGSLEERKNVSGLLKAFQSSGLSGKGFTLTIIGGDAQGSEEIRRIAAKVEGVEIKGFLEDRELEDYYRSSWAFVYPSMWEGFGLPMLEAMSKGLPCIASSHSAMAEVGEGAALFIDASDEGSIIKALLEASSWVTQKREELVSRSLERASDFSFDHFVSVLEQAVSEILARAPRPFFGLEKSESLLPSFSLFPWVEELPKDFEKIPDSHSEAYLLLILQLARVRMERQLADLSLQGDSTQRRNVLEREFASIEFAIEARIRELRRMREYEGAS